jgi:hypothetical protein
VRALLPGDISAAIVDGLDHPEEALFIEQRLEAALGITDREVATELPRRQGRGVPPGHHLVRADGGMRLGRILRRYALAALVSALPAIAIGLYHHKDTLASITLADEPQTLRFEVSPSKPDVYLATHTDIVIGDLRPESDLPAFDAVLTIRRSGSDEPAREMTCEITRRDDINYFFVRDGTPIQHVAWYGRLDHCPLELEPGSWEIEAIRRWRDRGLDTDRIDDSELRVEARR